MKEVTCPNCNKINIITDHEQDLFYQIPLYAIGKVCSCEIVLSTSFIIKNMQ